MWDPAILATRYCVSPRGFINASSRISPGVESLILFILVGSLENVPDDSSDLVASNIRSFRSARPWNPSIREIPGPFTLKDLAASAAKAIDQLI